MGGTSNSKKRCYSLVCFSSYWVALLASYMWTFALSYCIHFVLFGCHFLEVCGFLKKKQKKWIGEGGLGEQRGVEVGEDYGQDACFESRMYF